MINSIGKAIRMERITDRKTGKIVIVPMDHGVSVGPIKGLVDMSKTVDMVAEGGANAVIGHIALPRYGHRHYGKDIGLILHLSASSTLSPKPNKKVLVNTIENALRMGADGVSVHINIGDDDEAEMLRDLGRIAVECSYWGMPLVAMMYPRGSKIKDEKDVQVANQLRIFVAEYGVSCRVDFAPFLAEFGYGQARKKEKSEAYHSPYLYFGSIFYLEVGGTYPVNESIGISGVLTFKNYTYSAEQLPGNKKTNIELGYSDSSWGLGSGIAIHLQF